MRNSTKLNRARQKFDRHKSPWTLDKESLSILKDETALTKVAINQYARRIVSKLKRRPTKIAKSFYAPSAAEDFDNPTDFLIWILECIVDEGLKSAIGYAKDCDDFLSEEFPDFTRALLDYAEATRAFDSCVRKYMSLLP